MANTNDLKEKSDGIIKRLDAIGDITARYDDVIGREAAELAKECHIISAEEMRKQFAALADENRLLNIGIIGRVNAGKSSLLNSVFFNGDSVLPKAATPMTASLTVICHGDSFSATVEYYSRKDLDDIKRGHDEYERDWNDLYEVKKAEVTERAKKRGEAPDLDKAKRQADSDMIDKHHKYAEFDQYKRMKKAGGAAPAQSSQSINASGVSELLGKLKEYVGAEGRMMPWTKSVELRLPDFPDNIRVVDTPGINDPVKSREARTEDYLKQCDVVFIIISAGQFVTKEDTSLMDKLSSKEGVRELYFVAAQADNQLHGSPGEKANWDLNAAIENIRSELTEYALSTLEGIKKSNPEVACQFDQLLQDGRDRVMVTSAICHALLQKFDRRETWDPDMNHVWGLLTENYGDYFRGASAKASLGNLSGIKAVNEKIALVRQMKDDIIAAKQADYINSQEKSAAEFAEKLTVAVSEKIDLVSNTDIKSIEEKKRNIKRLCSDASEAIDGTFEDCVDEFKAELRETVSAKSHVLFDKVKNTTDGAVSTDTRIGERELEGFFNWISHLWGGGYKKYTYKVTTIRTGAVKSALNNLITNLQETLFGSAETAKTEWKASVQKRVTRALTEAVKDVELIDFGMLKTALRRMVNNMEMPELDLGKHAFRGSYSGALEGKKKVEDFLNEVYTYLSNLRSVFSKNTSNFLSMLEKSAKREKISGMLFKDMREQIGTLEKEIGNKKLTLERLSKCLSELKEAV